MRWPLLALLALAGLAFTPATTALPRGTQDFRLGWAYFQVDSALGARGAGVISHGPDYITAAGERPGVEYVLYSFVSTPQGPSFLWKVTVAYQVPYGRAEFDAVRDALLADLGPPADEHRTQPEAGDLEERITWVDLRTAVQLGARWSEIQDARADRMMVTWTDRRLQKLVEVQRRKTGARRGG
jgi:hypothetical protein